MVRGTTLLPEVKSHYGDLKNYVGGDWRTPETTAWLEDTNPATGQVIARVPLSTKDDVDRAVQEALRAWDAWRETPPLDRARHFFVLRDLMEQHSEDLARVVVQDMGKTIDEARGEIRRAIENVEVAAGIPSLMMGYNLEDGAGPGIDGELRSQPLGVFAGISPFNFPVMVQFWFWPYAVATGNCWIAKPSEQDPTAMQLVMDLANRAGFPPGVVNLVHGAKETVEAILDHPDIAGVSFVGSSAVAQTVYAKAAASGKRVQAGGGAKNVLVVMPDAKLDKVVSNLVSSCYGCAGERRPAGDDRGAGGDLRPGRKPVRGGRPRGCRPFDQRQSLWERGHDLHVEREARARLPIPRPRGKYRHQRRGRGADGLLPIRGDEELVLRRPPSAEPRRGPVLHGEQGRHHPVGLSRRRTTRFQVALGSHPKRGTETKLLIPRAHII